MQVKILTLPDGRFGLGRVGSQCRRQVPNLDALVGFCPNVVTESIKI